MADLGKGLERFDLRPENELAGASQGIIDFMNGIEITEEWLFERQRVKEEKKFPDPEDAYVEVRQREAERATEGLSPRVQFLAQDDPATQPGFEPTPEGSVNSSLGYTRARNLSV